MEGGYAGPLIKLHKPQDFSRDGHQAGPSPGVAEGLPHTVQWACHPPKEPHCDTAGPRPPEAACKTPTCPRTQGLGFLEISSGHHYG